MRHEGGNRPDGGYVHDPRDPGGETKYGISKRAHPDVNIRALTRDQAAEIYYKEYWLPLSLDKVRDPVIATEVFDTATNTGTGRAARILQESLNLLNRREGRGRMRVDGRVGPITLQNVEYWTRKDREALLALLNVKQGSFYLGLIQRRPTMIYALRSWMRRCLPPSLVTQ